MRGLCCAQVQLQVTILLLHQPDRLPIVSNGASATSELMQYSEMLAQVSQLGTEAKVALIRQLVSDLDAEQIQLLLEFIQREIAERHVSAATSVDRQTRLLLKKDYSYQQHGLSEPNQYYVYLRRRKPKLDRYIGTLFYVPQGCTLSYSTDAEGNIAFHPPHNVFQLQDAKNPSITKLVRLVRLEPPSPDYTFSKQQNDTPEIYLRVQYLVPTSYQILAEDVYLFPFCMYEGGKLDRYRWNVTEVILPDEEITQVQVKNTSSNSSFPALISRLDSTNTLSENSSSLDSLDDRQPSHRLLVENDLSKSTDLSKKLSTKSSRHVIELPSNKSIAFYLVDRQRSALILERMRLWVAWSETAMPQSRWQVVQSEAGYTLINASFKRVILSFSIHEMAVVIENSLPVLIQWFHDLSLAVSQSQNQQHYSSTQLKLARSIFVEMSLPQDNPLTVLKVLFGVEFSRSSPG
jgi:hypothetical protein